MSEEGHKIKFKEEIGFEEGIKEEKPIEEKQPEKKKFKLSVWHILIILVVVVGILAVATGKIQVTKTPPENYAPEITYHYDTHLNSLQGNVTLVTGIEDKDNDSLNVQFWVRENNSSKWIGIGNFEGYDGEYICLTKYVYGIGELKTAYWRVDVNDGTETTSGIYSFKFTGKK